jgi:hypothetical protein
MGDEARRAALDYADTDADGDLLDVGDTRVLHRMHVAEIRYEHDGALFDVDPDEYAQASPDPLRAVEFDPIADLTDHHAAEITAYVRLGPLAVADRVPAGRGAQQGIAHGASADGHGQAPACGSRYPTSPPDPPGRPRWKICGAPHHRSSAQARRPVVGVAERSRSPGWASPSAAPPQTRHGCAPLTRRL